jgi:hypothetical protein
MNAPDSPRSNDSQLNPPLFPKSPLAAPITAGLLIWLAITIGFFGLKMLMQERPEFVGPPMRVTSAQLVQESPQVVVRKMSDDISVIKPVQPESTDVRFDLAGRRDNRGLQTIVDMSGAFRARYVLTNSFEEPVFVLFKCPHPRSQNDDSQNLLAGEMRLQTSATGVQENTKDAWLWSGTLDTHSSVDIEISYHVGSLKGVSYRVGARSGNQVKQLRVTLNRKDLPVLLVESGDGAKRPTEETVVWERRDFLAPDFFSAHIVESRNLYASLSQLLQIGPLICLLFLLSVSSVILVRQPLTAIQMLTIAAGYAFYFPLILYLSANFTFVWALLIAVVVPGVLLMNYARWLLGGNFAVIGAALFLLLYQVFPTLAAFAGWNRGMMLLCLGVVTMAVLINLQNRALKQRTMAAAALLALCIFPFHAKGAEVQVTLPAELVAKLPESKLEKTNALVAFEPAQYQIRHEPTHLRVEAQLSVQVVRAGETPVPLFGAPVHLQTGKFESAEPDVARLVTVTNRLGLLAQRTGQGSLRLTYRVPFENREGKKRALVPLLAGPSGNVWLESARPDLEFMTGSLWTKVVAEKATIYDLGVAGEEALVIEWRDQDGGAGLVTAKQAEAAREFYGIGLTRAQNLTIINSDGSCTHFAEFELPVSQAEEFRLRLPAKSRLISISVNGTEISSPTVEDQLCRVRLPTREAQQTAHRLSFRIGYPLMRLGFVGMAELTLPEVYQTAGTLEWVVALPNGFDAQVISSGLETQKTPPDLARFGDYGRILKSQTHTHLAKSLAPPGVVNLSLKYRQLVSGIYESAAK